LPENADEIARLIAVNCQKNRPVLSVSSVAGWTRLPQKGSGERQCKNSK
jgi:hypothetical protein